MRTSRWAGSAVLAGISLLALGVPLIVGVAASSATGTAPAWEPDGNAAAPYGNVTFYDASGDQVTSGANLASPFAYAVAGTATDSGAIKATLYFANPKNGQAPGTWTATSEAGPTNFSSLPSGTPADIVADAATDPVVASSSASITNWLGSNVPDTTPGYANTIQVRLKDSGLGGAGNPTGTYWESDIGYNTTSSPITVDGTTVPADGWALLFPFVTPTTTTLATSATGGTVTPGSPITLTATVSNPGAGSVQVYDNGTALGSPVTGSSPFVYNYTPGLGTHVYTASFAPAFGDETGAGTASATIVGGSVSSSVTVEDSNGTATTTTLSASATSVTIGMPVTFTATVSASDSTHPAGTVEFLNGTTAITGCISVSINPPSSATCTTSTLPLGSDSVKAAFTPTSSSYATSTSSPTTVTVALVATTTALSASATTITIGASVTFTAMVSASDSTTQAGSVEFFDGTAAITGCTSVAVNTGGTASPATCTTSALPVGSDSVTAAFTPTSSSYATSTSPAKTVTVAAITTTIALSANATSGSPATSVTFTATVSASDSTHPAGTVEFLNGLAPITSCSTSVAINTGGTASSATCTTTLPVGSDSVTAEFTATSSSYGSSTSSPTTVTITLIATTTSLSASATSAAYGTSVTFTATVSAADSTNPAGTVDFELLSGSVAITGCNAVAVNTGGTASSATCTSSALPAGSDSIVALFTATSNAYATTTSTTVVVTVGGTATTTTLSASATSAAPGTSVTFTATASASDSTHPAGTVEFLDGSTPITGCAAVAVNTGGTASSATCTTSTLPVGSNIITATFTPTSNWSATSILVEAARRGDVGLDAHDRVDAQVLGRLVELQGPVQVAVVGQGQGVHAQLFGPLQQAGDLSGAVEQAVVAMAV